MNSSWDTIIVGAGIAGACAAIYHAEQARTLIIEADTPASGASRAAAGLVNPFMGRRARPIWRRREAQDGLVETLDRGNADDLFYQTGVLRIARDDAQAELYRQRHTEFPEETEWLPATVVAGRYPSLQAPDGALFIPWGGYIPVPDLVSRLFESAQNRGAHLLTSAPVTSWGEDEQGAYVVVDHHTRLYARRILLTLGAGFEQFPELRELGLRGVKGQTVTIQRPSGLESFPCVSGYGYIVPTPDRLVLGSTYEHNYSDDKPSSEQTRAIIHKVSRMLPSVDKCPVREERAGIRVMTPHTNKAMLGPLPGSEAIWFFGGLGSKGLLMAPMMARRLTEWLDRPSGIPAKLRINSTRTTQ